MSFPFISFNKIQRRNKIKSQLLTNSSYSHNFQIGDHIIRWTHLLLYPIQVHGIVLSSSKDHITIVDFGLTNSRYIINNEVYGPCHQDDCVNIISLEKEQHDMIGIWDQHRSDNIEKRRIHIVTLLSDEKEIRLWRRVKYGGEITLEKGSNFDTIRNIGSTHDNISFKCKDINSAIDNISNDIFKARTQKKKKKKNIKKITKSPSLPQADPPFLTLARVRYLLHNPHMLPEHHILYSNSECIAVWCKTGRWNTLQASIFLHSTTLSNIKSTVCTAAYVSAQTVTTSIPASGLWGYLGYTTTSTVSLTSINPWILPAIAGTGIVMITWPIVMLLKAKSIWNEVTKKLGDAFWGSASNDVFIEVIKSWSDL